MSRIAALGAAAWVALLGVPLGEGVLGTIARLLLLAMWVFVPLGLGVVGVSVAGGWVVPVAAALATASFFAAEGWAAAGLTVPWLGLAGWVAALGLRRLAARGLARAEEVCIGAAMVYLPVGAGWLALARLGANPLGFSDAIVLLTAIHFHYSAFALPILAGMAGRALRASGAGWAWGAFRVAAGGIVVGPALVAAGITGSRPLEVAAVLALTSSVVLLAALMLFVVVWRLRGRVARALLGLSALTLVVTMAFAAGYAVGGVTGWWGLDISRMVQVHGWGNALAVGCGLLGWGVARGRAHLLPSDEDG